MELDLKGNTLVEGATIAGRIYEGNTWEVYKKQTIIGLKNIWMVLVYLFI